MHSVGSRTGAPGQREGRDRFVCCEADRDAIEQELHTDDPDVVGCGGVRVVVPETVLPPKGALIVTVGAVQSIAPALPSRLWLLLPSCSRRRRGQWPSASPHSCPAVLYTWVGLLTMLVVPSPKLQAQLVTCPVVVLVNATLSGAIPLLGLAPKLTTGAAGATTLMAVAAALLTVPPGPLAVRTGL